EGVEAALRESGRRQQQGDGKDGSNAVLHGNLPGALDPTRAAKTRARVRNCGQTVSTIGFRASGLGGSEPPESLGAEPARCVASRLTMWRPRQATPSFRRESPCGAAFPAIRRRSLADGRISGRAIWAGAVANRMPPLPTGRTISPRLPVPPPSSVIDVRP